MSRLLFGLAVTAMVAAPQAMAETYGTMERVKVMGTAPIEVAAKLDSGNAQTALHAQSMKYFQKEGDTWVRFTIDNGSVLPGNHITIERKVLKDIKVKQAGGGIEHRAVVELELCLGSTSFTSKVLLSDRVTYTSPLLIGGNDLAALGKVDPAREYTHEPSCKPPEPAQPAAAETTKP